MATYKKPTIGVIGVTLMDYEFSGDGSVLDALKAHRTIKTQDGDGHPVLIPFHAVQTRTHSRHTEL